MKHLPCAQHTVVFKVESVLPMLIEENIYKESITHQKLDVSI